MEPEAPLGTGLGTGEGVTSGTGISSEGSGDTAGGGTSIDVSELISGSPLNNGDSRSDGLPDGGKGVLGFRDGMNSLQLGQLYWMVSNSSGRTRPLWELHRGQMRAYFDMRSSPIRESIRRSNQVGTATCWMMVGEPGDIGRIGAAFAGAFNGALGPSVGFAGDLVFAKSGSKRSKSPLVW